MGDAGRFRLACGHPPAVAGRTRAPTRAMRPRAARPPVAVAQGARCTVPAAAMVGHRYLVSNQDKHKCRRRAPATAAQVGWAGRDQPQAQLASAESLQPALRCHPLQDRVCVSLSTAATCLQTVDRTAFEQPSPHTNSPRHQYTILPTAASCHRSCPQSLTPPPSNMLHLASAPTAAARPQVRLRCLEWAGGRIGSGVCWRRRPGCGETTSPPVVAAAAYHRRYSAAGQLPAPCTSL